MLVHQLGGYWGDGCKQGDRNLFKKNYFIENKMKFKTNYKQIHEKTFSISKKNFISVSHDAEWAISWGLES